LTVYTHVLSSNGVVMTGPNPFYIRVTDNTGAIHSFRDFGPGHDIYLPEGTYQVTPTGPKGYTASLQGNCNGIIHISNDFSCTVNLHPNPSGLQQTASNYPSPAANDLQRPRNAIVIS